MKRTVLRVIIGAFLAGLFVAPTVYAASVTFTSPVGLLLVSPATTLTIASGSVADLVTLNATSVVASVSAGETFTLLSPTYDLSIGTSSGGGSVVNSCTSGFVTVALSQTSGSTIYTVTPGGTSCSNIIPTSTPPSSGGALSVGVPASYGSPSSVITQPISSGSVSSTAELQAELNALLAELEALQAEANGSSSSSSTGTIAFSYVFTRNLSQGMTGADVTELQKFLILENKGPAAQALEAHGTTKNFASLTSAALKEFQSTVNIHPASGYFGPITRAYVNAINEKSTAPNQL